MAVIMSTAYGSTARRNLLIPILMHQLTVTKGHIWESFTRANREMSKLSCDQVSTFHTTLDRQLILGNYYKLPEGIAEG